MSEVSECTFRHPIPKRIHLVKCAHLGGRYIEEWDWRLKLVPNSLFAPTDGGGRSFDTWEEAEDWLRLNDD